MNSDIRLQMGFYSSTKIKKLHRLLGAEGVLSLIFLWLYTAENRPHGELRGMHGTDIEIAAQWNGQNGEFVKVLSTEGTRFLDKKGSLFLIHDWKENNPYAFHAPDRKKRAKKGAAAKWAKYKENKVCSEQKQAMLNSATSNAPSPSPSPSPKEKKTKGLHDDSKIIYASLVSMTPDEYDKLIEQYGQPFTAACIAKLSNYKGASGKTYKSDYRAILTWVVDEVSKKFPIKTPQGERKVVL